MKNELTRVTSNGADSFMMDKGIMTTTNQESRQSRQPSQTFLNSMQVYSTAQSVDKFNLATSKKELP